MPQPKINDMLGARISKSSRDPRSQAKAVVRQENTAFDARQAREEAKQKRPLTTLSPRKPTHLSGSAPRGNTKAQSLPARGSGRARTPRLEIIEISSDSESAVEIVTPTPAPRKARTEQKDAAKIKLEAQESNAKRRSSSQNNAAHPNLKQGPSKKCAETGSKPCAPKRSISTSQSKPAQRRAQKPKGEAPPTPKNNKRATSVTSRKQSRTRPSEAHGKKPVVMVISDSDSNDGDESDVGGIDADMPRPVSTPSSRQLVKNMVEVKKEKGQPVGRNVHRSSKKPASPQASPTIDLTQLSSDESDSTVDSNPKPKPYLTPIKTEPCNDDSDASVENFCPKHEATDNSLLNETVDIPLYPSPNSSQDASADITPQPSPGIMVNLLTPPPFRHLKPRLMRDGVSEHAIKPTLMKLKQRISKGEEFPGNSYLMEVENAVAECKDATAALTSRRVPHAAQAIAAELDHRGIKTNAQYGNFWYNLMAEYSVLAGSPLPLFTMMKKAYDDFRDECLDIRRDLKQVTTPATQEVPTGLEALLLWGAGDTDEESISSNSEPDAHAHTSAKDVVRVKAEEFAEHITPQEVSPTSYQEPLDDDWLENYSSFHCKPVSPQASPEEMQATTSTTTTKKASVPQESSSTGKRKRTSEAESVPKGKEVTPRKRAKLSAKNRAKKNADKPRKSKFPGRSQLWAQWNPEAKSMGEDETRKTPRKCSSARRRGRHMSMLEHQSRHR